MFNKNVFEKNISSYISSTKSIRKNVRPKYVPTKKNSLKIFDQKIFDEIKFDQQKIDQK